MTVACSAVRLDVAWVVAWADAKVVYSADPSVGAWAGVLADEWVACSVDPWDVSLAAQWVDSSV